MIQKNTIIKGAFVLTLAGVTTRFMGFFYRIFLSRAFGEESVGLYQLAFPVYALCFSLCAAGIETAIARSTAAGRSQRDGSRTRAGLYSGFSLSLLLAFGLMLFIQKEAGSIALRFLGEPRCAPLLVILSLALPFSVMHSCIYGYYIGRKHTKVPALSQLLEQAVRVGAVTLLYWFFMERSIETGIALAAAGIVAGEAAAALSETCAGLKTCPHRNACPLGHTKRDCGRSSPWQSLSPAAACSSISCRAWRPSPSPQGCSPTVLAPGRP